MGVVSGARVIFLYGRQVHGSQYSSHCVYRVLELGYAAKGRCDMAEIMKAESSSAVCAPTAPAGHDSVAKAHVAPPNSVTDYGGRSQAGGHTVSANGTASTLRLLIIQSSLALGAFHYHQAVSRSSCIAVTAVSTIVTPA